MPKELAPTTDFVEVNIPESVSEDAKQVIFNHVIDRFNIAIGDTFDWGKYAPGGKFTKRLSKYIRETARSMGDEDNNPIFTDEGKEIVADLGQTYQNGLVGEQTAYIRLVNEFNWLRGDFGDQDSCFWGGRTIDREFLEANEALALQVWTADKPEHVSQQTMQKGQWIYSVARTWVSPLSTGNHVLFNAYCKHGVSPHMDLTVQGAIAEAYMNQCLGRQDGNNVVAERVQLNQEYRGDRRYNGFTIYVNGGQGILLNARQERNIKRVSLNWPREELICPNCHGFTGSPKQRDSCIDCGHPIDPVKAAEVLAEREARRERMATEFLTIAAEQLDILIRNPDFLTRTRTQANAAAYSTAQRVIERCFDHAGYSRNNHADRELIRNTANRVAQHGIDDALRYYDEHRTERLAETAWVNAHHRYELVMENFLAGRVRPHVLDIEADNEDDNEVDF